MKRILSFLCTIAILTTLCVGAIPTANSADMPMGYVEYTKIVAYIDDRPIRSYNINNYTYIVAEDLMGFGFQVHWDGTTGTLSLGERTGGITSTYTPDPSAPTSGRAMPYYYSQVKTVILPNHQITSYNIGGSSCINMDDLAKYYATDYVYDGVKGELRMTVNSCKHQYTTSTVAATCVSDGGTRYSCTLCGHSYLESTGKTAHNLDFNTYICSTCGGSFPPSLSMTSVEKSAANAAHWISQRQVWHQDEHNRYVLVFSLLDKNERELTAPAIVKIKIKNDNGDVVYSSIRTVTSDNYSSWWYNNGATKKWQATIYINDSDIAKGSTTNGKIYFEVVNSGYFNFGESILSINKLPKANLSDQCSLTLPTLPALGGSSSYPDGGTITGINYLFEETNNGQVKLTVNFSGYKNTGTSPLGSSPLKIDWNLCDADGNVLKSEYIYLSNLAPGESFGNVSRTIYYLEPGNYVIKFKEMISTKCSLSLPSLPTVGGASGYEETATITGIDYQFDESTSGKVKLTVNFSGKVNESLISKGKSTVNIAWNLCDIYGNIIESKTVYVQQIAPGETFHNASSIIFNLTPGNYILKMQEIETAKCSLTLPKLPETLGYYGYKNELKEQIKVTDIKYEFTNGYNGKVHLYLYFSGTKLFDSRGSGQSNAAKIGWKLYDAYGTVVESGTCYTAGLAMGESFRNQEDKVYSLTPGKYRLEILSVN